MLILAISLGIADAILSVTLLDVPTLLCGAIIGTAITLYLAKNGRMSSPKYLVGESYGGFRAIKVSRALQHDQGVVVSGIVMLSPLSPNRMMRY